MGMTREENPKFSGYKGPKNEIGIPIASSKDQTFSGVKTPSRTPTPTVNAKKIESNAKKIEKLMGMMKGKATSLIGRKEHLKEPVSASRRTIVQHPSSVSKSGKVVPYSFTDKTGRGLAARPVKY